MSKNPSELLPCPFCGGEAELLNVDMAGCQFVQCTECKASSDDTNAVARWNTRAAASQAEAAPVAEPVGWGNGDEIANMLCDRHAIITGVRSGWRNTPLYTAPPAAPGASLSYRERTPNDERVDAILNSRRRANIPHPREPGMRIVGWVVEEEVAGLSDSLFAIEQIERMAASLPRPQRREESSGPGDAT